MRILIAEDDYASRKFMYKFLSNYGDCDMAIDGREAVDAYLMGLSTKKEYDLICLDIMMPDIGGYEVLSAIRSIEKQHEIPDELCAKVVMTVTLKNQQHREKAFALGCTACIDKPFNSTEFEAVFQQIGMIP